MTFCTLSGGISEVRVLILKHVIYNERVRVLREISTLAGRHRLGWVQAEPLSLHGGRHGVRWIFSLLSFVLSKPDAMKVVLAAASVPPQV